MSNILNKELQIRTQEIEDEKSIINGLYVITHLFIIDIFIYLISMGLNHKTKRKKGAV